MGKYFDFQITKNWDRGFCIGITPIWFHSHYGDESPLHFHILISLGFYFMEIQIGKDAPDEE